MRLGPELVFRGQAEQVMGLGRAEDKGQILGIGQERVHGRILLRKRKQGNNQNVGKRNLVK